MNQTDEILKVIDLILFRFRNFEKQQKSVSLI